VIECFAMSQCFLPERDNKKIFDDDFVYFARQREIFVKMRRGKATSRVSLWEGGGEHLGATLTGR
jgi:hypothetical protein